MTFTNDDDETSVIVPANSTVNLINVPTLFETADAQPGIIIIIIIITVRAALAWT